jgi:hypothetical protein
VCPQIEEFQQLREGGSIKATERIRHALPDGAEDRRAQIDAGALSDAPQGIERESA